MLRQTFFPNAFYLLRNWLQLTNQPKAVLAIGERILTFFIPMNSSSFELTWNLLYEIRKPIRIRRPTYLKYPSFRIYLVTYIWSVLIMTLVSDRVYLGNLYVLPIFSDQIHMTLFLSDKRCCPSQKLCNSIFSHETAAPHYTYHHDFLMLLLLFQGSATFFPPVYEWKMWTYN